MSLDDSLMVELEKRAGAEHRVLRGAALKQVMADLAYGSDIKDLVQAATQPDVERAAEAFAKLVDRLWEGLVSVCYHFFPNVEEAADVARDVCRNVWLVRNRLDPSKNFEAYLKQSGRNHCIDLLRKDTRRGSFAWSQMGSTDAPVDSENTEGQPLIELVADPDTFSWEQRLHLKEAVERVLHRLAPVDRFVLLMRFDKGYSRAEIANELQCTEQSVGIHERKARQLFKDHFLQEWNVK